MVRNEEKIASAIAHIVPNLRFRWPELAPFSDRALALAYDDFATSEDHGNNDEKFPLWFEFLSDYENR